MVFLYAIHFVLLGFLIGPFDYDHLSGYYELAWRFWRTGGGLPEYNPYLCGGRTLGGDPQIPIFSPLTLLVPLLGATLAIKLELVAQLSLGVYGLRGWLRLLGASPNGVRWGTLLYVAGGGVVARFLVGHVTMGFFLLMPLFFYLSYCIDESRGRNKQRLLIGYFALFGYAALYKPNFLIHFVPIVIIEHIARSILKKRPGILLWFVGGTAFATLLSAVTWLPAWKYFLDFPRLQPAQGAFFPPYTWILSLLLPIRAIPNSLYGNFFLQRHEYNVFVTPVALVFAYWGLCLENQRRSAETRALVLFLIFSAWLGFGSISGPWARLFPYHWFSEFWPGFSSIRAPVRFWYGTYVVLIVLSAVGWREPKHRSWKVAWILLGVLPLLGSATFLLSKTTFDAHATQWSHPRIYPDTISWVEGGPDDSYQALRQGQGVLKCLYNIETFPSPDLVLGNTLSYALSAPGDIHLKWLGWNRIQIDAKSTASGFSVRLNLNHSPYWHFKGQGGEITSRLNSLLTISSAQPELHGQLVYEQPLVPLAAAISGVSLLAFLFLSILLWRRDR